VFGSAVLQLESKLSSVSTAFPRAQHEAKVAVVAAAPLAAATAPFASSGPDPVDPTASDPDSHDPVSADGLDPDPVDPTASDPDSHGPVSVNTLDATDAFFSK
jgi:hypothetical protein